MVKAEVTETFTLKDYNKVEVISKRSDKPHEFTKGDVFKCDDETADYLSGNNALKKNVIKVLEVIPKEEEKAEETEKPKKIAEPKKKKIDKKVK
jgi:hypothetical protein